VIDNNSGMKWAENAGAVFDRLDVEGKQEAVDAGHTIREIENPLQHPDWQEPLETGIENYLTQLEERGLSQAREVYEAALAASESCGTQEG
jgi:hypothetical protein